MKRMKKIMALMLAAIMMMAMSVTAFAEEGTAPAAARAKSLTVSVKSGAGVPTQTLKDQTIYLYKLFDVTESGTTGAKNYAYTVNTAAGYKDVLVATLNNSAITASSTDEDIANAVRNIGSSDTQKVQNFANTFTTNALTKNPKLDATTDSGKLGDVTSYKFTGLDAGYYLVYVTGGKEIQSSLVTVDANTTTVNLKSETPSIEKIADKDTVSIGQVVKYTVTGSIPDTTGYAEYVYKIHDTLSTGLDFVKNADGDALDNATEANVTIAFNDTGVTAAGTTPTTAALSGEGNRTMALDLSAWVRDNQANKGKAFTVTYYAKVNKAAVVTEQNKAHLEYGNDSGNTTTTTPSEAKTPTYPLDILKKKAGTEGASLEKLAGAKFRLYSSEADAKANDESKAIKVSPVVAGVAGNYVVDPASTTTEFESVENIEEKGYNLHVNGLAEGTYYLVETQAPEGFNKLTDPIKVTITKDSDTNWNVKKNDTAEDDKIIDVENSTGSLLPSTGGRGAIVFAVIAALLVFGVVVSFIRDKRKEA